MSLPTIAEVYDRLSSRLIQCQEDAATLAHLYNDTDSTSRTMAIGWLKIEDNLKKFRQMVMLLKMGRLNS